MSWLSWTGIAVALVILALVSMAWFRGAKWSKATSNRFVEVQESAKGDRGWRVDLDGLDSLPRPVARYLRMVLTDGQAPIRTARFQQTGSLRISPEAERWSPFEAEQVVSGGPAGFVWDARVRVAPLTSVRVRDLYVRGHAAGAVQALSLISMGRASSSPELDSGALHRYLAEAPWYPTVLLPEAGVTWSPIAENRALATLTDGATTVSLEYRFNEAGEVSGIYTPNRYRLIDNGFETRPWEGSFSGYERRSGLLIPMEGEIGWHLENGWWSFWKGRITSVDYTFDSDPAG